MTMLKTIKVKGTKSRLSFYSVLFSIVLVAACASPRPVVPPPLREADIYPNAQTIAGLAVAVDEISDPERVRQYFGTDLTEDDILPVNIIFSNKGEESFLVKPSDILLLESGTVIDPMPVAAIQKRAGSGLEQIVLQETVVQPGDKYQGVLFFRVKKKGSGLYSKVERLFVDRLKMRIVVTNQGSEERILFGPIPLAGW
jgi:hypothetical protein